MMEEPPHLPGVEIKFEKQIPIAFETFSDSDLVTKVKSKIKEWDHLNDAERVRLVLFITEILDRLLERDEEFDKQKNSNLELQALIRGQATNYLELKKELDSKIDVLYKPVAATPEQWGNEIHKSCGHKNIEHKRFADLDGPCIVEGICGSRDNLHKL